MILPFPDRSSVSSLFSPTFKLHGGGQSMWFPFCCLPYATCFLCSPLPYHSPAYPPWHKLYSSFPIMVSIVVSPNLPTVMSPCSSPSWVRVNRYSGAGHSTFPPSYVGQSEACSPGASSGHGTLCCHSGPTLLLLGRVIWSEHIGEDTSCYRSNWLFFHQAESWSKQWWEAWLPPSPCPPTTQTGSLCLVCSDCGCWVLQSCGACSVWWEQWTCPAPIS